MSEEPTGIDGIRKRFRFERWLATGVLFVVCTILLGVVGVGLLGLVVYDHVLVDGVPGPKVALTVPEGMTGREVGDLLVEQGLLEHEGFFRLAMRLDKTGKGIKHGAYELPQGLSATQLLARIQDGPAKHLIDDIKVTIPEGLSIAQMADLFENPTAFIEAASDPELIAKIGLDVANLEGFLLPETYFFNEKPTERAVVERMLQQYMDSYAQLLAEIPGAEAYDKLQVTTVASLVEEEARLDEERATVASVVYNRMEINMALQMDSTLQFALGKYGQRMLNEDKEVESPYNTYKYPGLPPGPISSPGVASLRAALQPEQSKYIYFVSNADGKSHTFTTNLRDHERAVAKYRREIAEQRRLLE